MRASRESIVSWSAAHENTAGRCDLLTHTSPSDWFKSPHDTGLTILVFYWLRNDSKLFSFLFTSWVSAVMRIWSNWGTYWTLLLFWLRAELQRKWDLQGCWPVQMVTTAVDRVMGGLQRGQMAAMALPSRKLWGSGQSGKYSRWSAICWRQRPARNTVTLHKVSFSKVIQGQLQHCVGISWDTRFISSFKMCFFSIHFI